MYEGVRDSRSRHPNIEKNFNENSGERLSEWVYFDQLDETISLLSRNLFVLEWFVLAFVDKPQLNISIHIELSAAIPFDSDSLNDNLYPLAFSEFFSKQIS